MKAVLHRAYGPAESVLEIGEVDPPVPQAGEVLVRVYASSVHADIWHIVTGLPRVMRLMGAGLFRPRCGILGTDLAGVVEAVGAGVTRFSPGDAVFGDACNHFQWASAGTWAELVAVPEAILQPKPAAVTFEQAASVPTSGLIALQNMRAVSLEPGHRVLVNGAGGGVGSVGLQIAKAAGAEVTAVDRGDKLELLRALGADHVVDYTRADPLDTEQRFDLVLDVASTLDYDRVRPRLTPSGKYVRIGHMHYEEERNRTFGNLPGFFALVARSGRDPHLPDGGLEQHPDDLAILAKMLEEGTLTPVVGRVFPLEQPVEAIEALKEGNVTGRIVIRVHAEEST